MVINNTLPIIKDIIKDMFLNSSTPSDMLENFKIADLGCSSGPNTLLFVSEIIDTINKLSKQNSNKTQEISVLLNDLPKNDFNNIFSALPSFYELLKKKHGYELSRKGFISGVAASFYERLVPCKSLHFVHSSYCLHWLSQVPENLENKEHIYMSKTRDPNVFNAYKNQFYKDFSSFLTHRSREILPMGRMVLTLVGRESPDPSEDDGCHVIELLAQSLLDVVSQGLIKQEDIDSFNLPVYHPCKDEVKEIIHNENSFHLEKLEVFECDWNPHDNDHGDGDYNYKFDKKTKRRNCSKFS
ncbi:probable jasmonic acid carboxyl methyltransferase 2 [Impatiens glandulifera]|uniref:probable jasmonic acid carboxyl methyltransferase 2 n=1 Tax=Impatiens glandulifera TaxID=253017 RepID=UPI001FB1881F|nr:probable jasmonic acid carboxyl methyltransferase 2 [Impatiens glandulifera]